MIFQCRSSFASWGCKLL